MKLRTQFTILMVISFTIFLLIGVSAYYTNQQIARINEQEQIASNVVKGAYQLSYLSNDYLFHIRETRQNLQWESKYIGLSDDIARLNPGTPEQQALVDQIKGNQQRLNDVYTQSVVTIEASQKSVPGKLVDPELVQVAWSRFIVQNQGMIFDASQLSQVLQEESDQLQRTNTTIIFTLIGLFLVILLVIFLFFNRRVLDSISSLQEGTRIIGSGNLEYRIEHKDDDEIGELSDEFNRMTSNLKSVTASKTDLEQEIAERKRAEQELQNSLSFLNSLIDQSPLSMWIADEKGTLIRINKACCDLFSLTPAEVIGKYNIFSDNLILEQGFLPLVRDVFLKGLTANFQIIYDTQKLKNLELERPMSFILDVTIFPVKDTRGKITNAVVQHFDITERTRVEAALQESELKFRDTITSLDEGYYSCTMDGLLIDHNPAFNRILGIDIAKDMKGAKLPEFWQNPHDRKEYLNELMSRGFIRNYIIGAKTINDEKRVFLVNSHLVKDETGKVMRIEGTFTDFTDRKRVEEELKTSEEKFSTAFKTSPYAITITRFVDGRFIEVNDAFTPFTGFTIEEALSDSSVGLSLWADPEDRNRVIADLREGRAVNGREFQFRKKNGELMTGLFSARIIKLGTEPCILSSISDITERKQTEGQLLLKNNVFESSIAANSIANNQGIITHVNPAFLILWGYQTQEEAIGNSVSSFFAHEEDGAQVLEALNTLGRWEGEFLAKKTDGSTFISQGIATVIGDEKGEPIGYQSTNLDITERKRADEELARSNRELQQFAYVSSHDLQEPLRMISSFVQLIEKRYKGKLDKDADEFIAYIVEGTSRMQRMIQDLLIFSRVQSRGAEFAPVDINQVFEKTVFFHQIMITEAGALVTKDDLPTVMGDETQLSQLFGNLIDNAIKFRRAEETPNVHISAQRKGNNWEFSVQDNGIGIDPQYFDRIFIIFQRLHSREAYEGTGIGLAICMRIVERHGGRIWVESEPGRGSLFHFTLPAVK